MVQGLIYLWVRYRMRKLITVHLQALPIQISLRIVHGVHYKKNDDWQPSMRRNYRTKLGLGYDEAKFNYLNNSQFSCFYFIVIKIKEKRRCQFKNNISSYCRSSPSSGQDSNWLVLKVHSGINVLKGLVVCGTAQWNNDRYWVWSFRVRIHIQM